MKEELLLSAPIFDVKRKEFDGPNGPLTRYIVEHPGAVTILPMLDADTVVMIRNYRHAIGKKILELPAGCLEKDEEPIECAKRELIEETGYEAGGIQPLGSYLVSPGYSTEKMYVFVAVGLQFVGQKLESGEDITVEKISATKLSKMLLGGELCDGKTMLVLAMAFLEAAQINRKNK